VEPGTFALGGAGHVSTWRCAATFTGAKLQAELAHWGAHAPVAVDALVVLPGRQARAAPEPRLYAARAAANAGRGGAGRDARRGRRAAALGGRRGACRAAARGRAARA